MTLDEFLDDYVPRVLKPMKGWEITHTGKIRWCADKDGWGSCPLTAKRRKESCFWDSGPLGNTKAARRLVAAADRTEFVGFKPNRRIRARLLAGLGLSEPAGERGRA
jgi:hypothetical protein